MKNRKILLSVALGAACLAGNAAVGHSQTSIQPDDSKIKNSGINPIKGQTLNKNIINRSTGSGTGTSGPQTPVWPPDDTKVKCAGINTCKGKGACRGAANSCAGQNGCKGKGWLEVTAKECRDKKGTLIEDSDNKNSK